MLVNTLVRNMAAEFGRKYKHDSWRRLQGRCVFVNALYSVGLELEKMSGINLIMANFNRNMWSQFISVNKDNFILYFVI
jgi:hypothetical protein